MSTNNKAGDGGENKGNLTARQLYKLRMDLEEKRKFGLAPLEVDTVTKQEISPNVPHHMTQAPWFYEVQGPTLAHQKKMSSDDTESFTALRDTKDTVKVSGQAKTFVAGACQNCGARTHKTQHCFYAKKKVATKYSGQVTGKDLELHKGEDGDGKEHAPGTVFGMKRDRFEGEIGVNLLRRGDLTKSVVKGGSGQKHTASEEEETKRLKLEGVFSGSTAQHGGVEIKSVPKYLENLDASDSVLFDPTTGAMRGNPNAHDPTRLFQGDLQRYRSGDFHNYVEAQHRFLTGQSSSYVDFEFDEDIRKRKEEPVSGKGKEVVLSPEEALVQSLYGTRSTPQTATTATPTQDATPIPLETPKTSAFVVYPSATFNGHLYPYGSYFSAETFAWGYKCCKGIGREAPSCSTRIT